MSERDAANSKKKVKPLLIIHSEKEFESLMNDVDQEMIDRNTDITARAITAGIIISERYDIILNAVPPDREPKENIFDPLEISIRVYRWVRRRYGARLLLDFSIGRTIVPLRGDIYVISIPRVYGNASVVIEPNQFGIKSALKKDEVPKINIVNQIEGCTYDLAQSLSASEALKISLAFIAALRAYSTLNVIRGKAFVKEAIDNLNSAVYYLALQQANPGLSKWESLQSVEKIVKCYVQSKGGNFKKNHDLKQLFEIAQQSGLPVPSVDYINAVQCSAGVRYGEIKVSRDESVIAHLIAIEICELCAQLIVQIFCLPVPKISELQVDGITIKAFLSKYQIRRDFPQRCA